MPTDEILKFTDGGANQDPLLRELFNHHHPCWVKDDTLHSTVRHTRSGLELRLQFSLPIWNGCIGLCNT